MSSAPMFQEYNPDAACMYLVRNVYQVYEESKEIQEGSPPNNIFVGN